MIAATNALVDGHGLLADWLLLVAAVLFVIAAVLAHPRTGPVVETDARRRGITAAEVGYAGLAVAAVAFLVL
jgi:hypothetical protein